MSDIKVIEEDGPNYKGIWLFGYDLRKIDCFRESFLNGYVGAAVGSVIGYVYKNQFKVAFEAAYASFVITTLCTWLSCRYKSYKRRKELIGIEKVLEDTVEKSGEYNIPNYIKKKRNLTDE